MKQTSTQSEQNWLMGMNWGHFIPIWDWGSESD
jgi:hypothetical protein